tara:strand:+ start:175 stop:405 length:231 start_codon:yes stop_codon:yes gene_type:complete
MIYSIKKFIFALIFNTSFLIILIIGIQNSTQKNRVNLILNKTIELPVSFIIGITFISGSLVGSVFDLSKILNKIKD